MSSHYNLMALYLLQVLGVGVGMVMVAFNGLEIVNRTNCSPISPANRSIQLLLGNLLFALVFWLFAILVGFIFYGSKMISPNAVLFALNTFVLTLTVLSISFLIGSQIKNREAVQTIPAILAIAMTTLSGVFVPQEVLGESVLRVARFMPAYWFVRANYKIQALCDFAISKLVLIFEDMIIVLVFGFVALFTALLISKMKVRFFLQ
ncbi:MAG: ABC transporter permease [Alkaliphilus sp.]